MYRDMEGRLLSLIVKFEQQVVKLVCIYALNNVKERKSFFQSLPLHLKGKNQGEKELLSVFTITLEREESHYTRG